MTHDQISHYIISARIGGTEYWWDGMYWTSSKHEADKIDELEDAIACQEKILSEAESHFTVFVDPVYKKQETPTGRNLSGSALI